MVVVQRTFANQSLGHTSYDKIACKVMKSAILLRGINVGGHNKLSMGDLKQALAGIGYPDAVTYLNSGNLIVEADHVVEAAAVSDLIESKFKLNIPVVVQKKAQIIAAVKNNPFKKFEPKKLHIMYLDGSVSAAKAKKLDTKPYAPDKITVKGRHVYVLYEKDSWSSKATIEVPEKNFGVTATARNWNTAQKLAELMDDI